VTVCFLGFVLVGGFGLGWFWRGFGVVFNILFGGLLVI